MTPPSPEGSSLKGSFSSPPSPLDRDRRLSKYQTLILGCGHPLLGDDGFGPAVVRYLLTHFSLPEKVLVLEVGTSLWEVLLEVALSEPRPRKLILVDVVKAPDRSPGEVFEIKGADLLLLRRAALSLHQFPPMEVFRTLKETGVALHFLVAQGQHFPNYPAPGLSPALLRALPEACRRIFSLL